jgi:hypothetical protein
MIYAIFRAWNGEPWDDVEVLSGKVMKPVPGKKKTILFGKCMCQANKHFVRPVSMLILPFLKTWIRLRENI